MIENYPQESAGASVKEAASATVSEGIDIRSRVHDITLLAMTRRRLDRHGLREVVRAVTEGIASGAEKNRGDMRLALSEAFRGLDDAVKRSAEASREALRQLTATSRDFSERELKQALANIRRIEEDFINTASQAADAANATVRPELRQVIHNARQAGTETSRQVAATMTEFAHRFSVASIDAALAGLEAATEVGARFSQIASGILGGIADALAQPRSDTTAATQESTASDRPSA